MTIGEAFSEGAGISNFPLLLIAIILVLIVVFLGGTSVLALGQKLRDLRSGENLGRVAVAVFVIFVGILFILAIFSLFSI